MGTLDRRHRSFFFQEEDGIRAIGVTGVQTCALPICSVRRLRVNVPPGVRDGSRIRLAGKGEPGLRGTPPGDLYVITRVSESPVFKWSGENLEVDRKSVV